MDLYFFKSQNLYLYSFEQLTNTLQGSSHNFLTCFVCPSKICMHFNRGFVVHILIVLSALELASLLLLSKIIS